MVWFSRDESIDPGQDFALVSRQGVEPPACDPEFPKMNKPRVFAEVAPVVEAPKGPEITNLLPNETEAVLVVKLLGELDESDGVLVVGLWSELG